MQSVSVYDIATDRWYVLDSGSRLHDSGILTGHRYSQNTTGDIPPSLTKFCSVYASAPDGSSHNIYIYGGYSGGTPVAEPSDNVYVLSLPSFEWTLLYSGEGHVDARSEHTCIRHYPDQMLVLGGTGPSVLDCIDIIRVFNLNTAMFQDSYDTVTWSDYQVPILVSGRIGGK
jgi:hypothetical protein